MKDNKNRQFRLTIEEILKVDEIINKYKAVKGALIPILNEIQIAIGFLPVEVQKKVAQQINIPEKDVYGVVSFYSFFSMTPRGKTNIRVCLGTACFVRGGKKIAEKIEKELGIGPGEVTDDRKYSLQINRCLGACGIAPVMVVNDKIFQKVQPEEAIKIIKSFNN